MADQLTKLWAARMLPSHPYPVLGDLLRLTLIYNPKGVFGLPIGSSIGYYILSGVGIATVLYLVFRTRHWPQATALGFILGGAAGNLIDRVRLGKVIDFIDIGVTELRWPTFNLADALIVVGIIVILGLEVKKERKG